MLKNDSSLFSFLSGLALKALGKHNEAIKCFDTAIKMGKKMNKENAVAYTNKVMKFSKSVVDARSKTHRFHVCQENVQGNILQIQGEDELAVECYTRSVQIDGTIAVTHNNMVSQCKRI